MRLGVDANLDVFRRFTCLIVPRISLSHLPSMLWFAVLGALVSGAYGVLHDQITYSISPEYFTRLKFHQFAYADFGFPRRIFVGEIGFLATWWVGAFVGWFLARIAVPAWPAERARSLVFRGFALVMAFAFAGGLTGGILGWLRRSDPDFGPWNAFRDSARITDLPAFVNVGYIHNAGYAGGLVGLVVAAAILWLLRRREERDRGE